MKRLIELLSKAFNRLVSLLERIGRDKLYHFIAGMIIAAFFIISLDFKLAFIPVMFAAVIKEAFDSARGGEMDLADFLWTMAGGCIVNLLVLI